MKILTVLRMIPLLAALCFLNGCGSVPSPLNDLTISVETIKPLAHGPANEAEVTLHFVNANEVAAAISRSTHKLYLNGNYVGKAQSNVATPLPRMGARTETMKIQFENAGALEKAIASSNHGAVPYRLDSEVFYDVDEDRQSTKLTFSGTIDLHELAAGLGK